MPAQTTYNTYRKALDVYSDAMSRFACDHSAYARNTLEIYRRDVVKARAAWEASLALERERMFA